MTFLSILVLVGAVQGLVSAFLFLSRRNNIIQNRSLSLILVFLSTALINIVLMNAGVRYQSPTANLVAYVVPLLVVMPVGPLLYFYVAGSLDPDFKFRPSLRAHFYSTIIDLLPYIVGLIFVLGIITGSISAASEPHWRNVMDEYNVYTDIIRWASITTYVIFSMRLVKEYSKKADDNTVKWLRQFTTVFATFQLIWLLHLLPYLLPALRNNFIDLVTWYPIYIPLAIMIYWLSINGYLRLTYVVNRKATLPPGVVEEADRILTEAMEKDRLFLDPGLTVSKLAKITGLGQKTISGFLNQHRGITFNQYINSYRVEELKRRLKSSTDQHLTITGLGLECGFNSTATMQRAFREMVRCSPRQYQLANG
jgi:AraC-like DNA-binding protein